MEFRNLTEDRQHARNKSNLIDKCKKTLAERGSAYILFLIVPICTQNNKFSLKINRILFIFVPMSSPQSALSGGDLGGDSYGKVSQNPFGEIGYVHH